MANYWYVRDDGGTNVGTAVGAAVDTGDGIYSTQKTGTWASAFSAPSEYFSSLDAIKAALGASVADGDIVFFASDHDGSSTGGAGPSPGTLIGIGVLMISVDITDIEAYLPGAAEGFAANDLNITGNVAFYGIDLHAGDDIKVNSSSMVYFNDLKLSSDASGDIALVTFVNSNTVCKNVTFDTLATGAHAIDVSGVIELYGCKTNMTAQSTSLIRGKGYLYAKGCDFSDFTGTLFGTTADMGVSVFDHCTLNASVTTGTLTAALSRVSFFGCDGTDIHSFSVESATGKAANNDATYVTATEPWYEGSDKSSIEITTTALCSHILPFYFELPAQYVNLANTDTDVITLDLITTHATTAIDLTDVDIAAFLIYPDSTTNVPIPITSSITTSTGSFVVDPLAAGTALPTSGLGAGDWTGELSDTNFYEMVLDASGTPGQATAVSIRIEVYTPSIAAGELFIHPLITVSAT